MSADALAYLDSSAFVKLLAAEAESVALGRYLEAWPRWTSSALLRVEGLRAAARSGANAVAAGRTLLRAITLSPIDHAILEQAAAIGPPQLRSLDAIHLATAQQLGSDLGVIVTYDLRMMDAARALGFQVAAPA